MLVLVDTVDMMRWGGDERERERARVRESSDSHETAKFIR